jgi:hypothetical protein
MAPIEILDIGSSVVRTLPIHAPIYACTNDDLIQVLGSRQTQEDRHAIAKLGTLTFDKSLACFAVYDGQYARCSSVKKSHR